MNSDFKELLELLNLFQVEYLLVGGMAVIEYSEPRYTKDIDLWIKANIENGEKTFLALTRFGAPLTGLSALDFSKEGFFFQMGLPPSRVDILMSLPGLNFDEAWKRRGQANLYGVEVPIISAEDLLTNKRLVGRKQDLLDVENLEKALILSASSKKK